MNSADKLHKLNIEEIKIKILYWSKDLINNYLCSSNISESVVQNSRIEVFDNEKQSLKNKDS